jgi:hypothetical protein
MLHGRRQTILIRRLTPHGEQKSPEGRTRRSLLEERAGMGMTQLPGNHHITYQLQYRKCGKPSCHTYRSGPGHGPYWYAYWREGSRLRSTYIGKVRSPSQDTSLGSSTLESTLETGSGLPREEPTPERRTGTR